MSTLKLDTLSNKAGTASVPSDTIVSGTAKAWVNFNGTGTVAIRRAFNVSSITDVGTGLFQVNFTNAMSDANYSWTVNGVVNGYTPSLEAGAAPTTTSLQVRGGAGEWNGSTFVNNDRAYVTAIIFS